MDGDAGRLPEGVGESFVRATYLDNEESRTIVRRGLSDPSARYRSLALRAGAAHDWITPSQWRDALGDRDPDVRREAATLLARRDVDDEVLNLLITLSGDDDALVADAAIFALGEHAYRPAVERLMEIVRGHDDARCRESAVGALGSIGDDRAREVLVGALEDKPAVRRRVIVALSNFEGPDIEAALDRAAQDRDWQVRAAVDQLRAQID